jgi:uncharacterized protein YbaA (DUF1428 family)
MAYVDGFLLPVPTKNLAAYRKMSQQAGEVWMEHGALDYKECVGDDLDVQGMTASFVTNSFPKMMKLKPGNALVFSWIVYASKAERTRILKKVMADPRLQAPGKMPFDPKQMLYGGFNVIVDMAPNTTPKRVKKSAAKKKAAAKRKARR